MDVTTVEITGSILLSILSGLVASGVFLLVLSKFRPNIEISPFIAREKDAKGKFFAFKIINKSPRSCISVKVDASLAKRKNVEEGHMNWTTHLLLKQAEVFEIAKYDPKDPEADYAWRFVTEEDLDTLWHSAADTIRFAVIATDSLTGFSRAFERKYRVAHISIKDGSHQFGSKLDVT